MSDVTPNGFKIGEKLGPLPLWGWGVIVAGFFFLVYFLYTRGRGTAQTGSQLSSAGYDTSGLPQTNSNDANNGTTNYNTATNTTWLSQAISSVASALGKSPSDVSKILNDYIAGNSIDVSNQSVVDKAIQMFGSPPTGTTGTSDFTAGGYDTGLLAQIGQVYKNALGRPATLAEEQTWAGRIQSGYNGQQFSFSDFTNYVQNSAEAQKYRSTGLGKNPNPSSATVGY
jgi:hypothetical protein